MTPPFSDDLISAYLDGELTPDQQALVEQQLSQRADLRRMRDDLVLLRRTLQALPTAEPPDNLAERVLRQAERRMLAGEAGDDAPFPVVADSRGTVARPPARRAAHKWPAAAVVAAVAAVGLIMILWPWDASRDVAQRPEATSTVPAAEEPGAVSAEQERGELQERPSPSAGDALPGGRLETVAAAPPAASEKQLEAPPGPPAMLAPDTLPPAPEPQAADAAPTATVLDAAGEPEPASSPPALANGPSRVERPGAPEAHFGLGGALGGRKHMGGAMGMGMGGPGVPPADFGFGSPSGGAPRADGAAGMGAGGSPEGYSGPGNARRGVRDSGGPAPRRQRDVPRARSLGAALGPPAPGMSAAPAARAPAGAAVLSAPEAATQDHAADDLAEAADDGPEPAVPAEDAGTGPVVAEPGLAAPVGTVEQIVSQLDQDRVVLVRVQLPTAELGLALAELSSTNRTRVLTASGAVVPVEQAQTHGGTPEARDAAEPGPLEHELATPSTVIVDGSREQIRRSLSDLATRRGVDIQPVTLGFFAGQRGLRRQAAIAAKTPLAAEQAAPPRLQPLEALDKSEDRGETLVPRDAYAHAAEQPDSSGDNRTLIYLLLRVGDESDTPEPAESAAASPHSP